MLFTYTSMRPLPCGNYTSKEQNDLIRDYCTENQLTFSLPYPEYVYPKCFIQLLNILSLSENSSAILAFSITQFHDIPFEINALTEKLILKDIDLHLCLEGLVFSNKFISQKTNVIPLYKLNELKN